jgi:hypothetical protein
MRRVAASLLSLCLVATVPALAQEEPPARVGRVSFVEGQLAFHTQGETSWSAASVNYPVATGGAFWADPKSRAEMRIGAQTVSLSGNAEIDVVRLDEQVVQLAVPQGRIELRLRSLAEGNTIEIDIPRGGAWLLQPGTYDIDAGTPDQPARIMVLDGSAHFTGGSVDIAIKAGDVAVIGGTDTLTASLEHAAPDAFAEWCRARNHPENSVVATKYVSPRMTGYEELDQFGAWSATADYGQVWYPRSMPADWAPYRDGHWVSVPPWGWTWVDAQPWGFAPFHYGRWARIEDRWAWVPGRLVPQPVYAPALVAFVGGGAGFAAAGAAGPAVGWFPLAPGEAYWPSYTSNRTYIRNVNITNVNETTVSNITNVAGNRPAAGPPAQFINQAFANRAAATVVPARAFASATAVAPAVLHVPPQALQQAAVSVRPPQVPQPVRPGHQANVPPVAAPATHPPGAPAASIPGTPPAIHPPGVATTAPAIAPAARGPERMPTAAAHAPPPAIHQPPPAEHASPAAIRVPPPEIHPPAATEHAPAASAHTPPPAMHAPTATERAAPAAAHAPPSPVHAPPTAEHAAPTAAHPPPAMPASPATEHAAPAAAHVPPPPVHAPPAAEHAAPAAAHPPPPPVHAPPAAEHAAPAASHAPPPPVHAPPAAEHAAPAAAHPPQPQAAPQRGGQPAKKDEKKDEKKD